MATPTQTTNYENACSLVTLLQILRRRPRPSRIGDADDADTYTSSMSSAAEWFQFANVRLKKERGSELLPFPPVHKRPHALVLRMVVDGGAGSDLGGGRDRGGSYGPHGGGAPPTSGGSYYRRRTSSGLSNGSFCSSSLDASAAAAAAAPGGSHRQHNPSDLSGSIYSAGGYAADHHNQHGVGGYQQQQPLTDWRTLETWTIEAFSEATMKATHAVATRAQLAGLCRYLCTHNILNSLPDTIYRVGVLETTAASSFTQADREALMVNRYRHNSGSSAAAANRGSSPQSMGSSSRQASPAPCPEGWEEQRWPLTTAEGIPCLILTWRYHKQAVQHLLSGGGGVGGSLTRRLSRISPQPQHHQQQVVSASFTGRSTTPTAGCCSSYPTGGTSGGVGGGVYNSSAANFNSNSTFGNNSSFDHRAAGVVGGGGGLSGGHSTTSPIPLAGGGGGTSLLNPPTSANDTSSATPKSMTPVGSIGRDVVSGRRSGPHSVPTPHVTVTAPTAGSQSAHQHRQQGVHYPPPYDPRAHIATPEMLFALIEGCERLTSNTLPHPLDGGGGVGASRHGEEDPYAVRDAVAEYRQTMAKVRQLTDKARRVEGRQSSRRR